MITDEVGESIIDITQDDSDAKVAHDDTQKQVGANEMNSTNNQIENSDSHQPSRHCMPNKLIFNDKYVVNQAILCSERDPQTVDDIFESEHADEWKQAMADEIQAHLDNKTWVLSDVPEGRRPIKCKWVFKTKLTADGQIEHFKARLVAKGCAQQPGVDFDETYSPVVRYTSV